jgi:acid phosphatase type 7
MSVTTFEAIAQCHELGKAPAEPLPYASGKNPYRLRLADVLGDEKVRQIAESGQIVFHVLGDQGWNDTLGRNAQEQVIRAMTKDLNTPLDPKDRAAFLYVVGDVIYSEDDPQRPNQYKDQFYDPHIDYKAPIFAIPGTHDGQHPDDVPVDRSHALQSFMRNFCAKKQSGWIYDPNVPREPVPQPNCYWTLDCPFVRIIGLYVNVPCPGEIGDHQQEWLTAELKDVPKTKAVILALYHPIYGSIKQCQGSPLLKLQIQEAVAAADFRVPDLFVSGHYHCYQHLFKSEGLTKGHHMIVGTGGKNPLYDVATKWEQLIDDLATDDVNGVEMKFSSSSNGYMRITITTQKLKAEYFNTLREPKLVDHFDIELQSR